MPLLKFVEPCITVVITGMTSVFSFDRLFLSCVTRLFLFLGLVFFVDCSRQSLVIESMSAALVLETFKIFLAENPCRALESTFGPLS